eukprot:m.296668 g.296668  ORF g.296668 m.296668 type:complete len:446 (-) comp20070_c0_seq3:169-1506(-)
MAQKGDAPVAGLEIQTSGEPLGVGVFGIVYKARDTRTDTLLAAKVFTAAACGDHDAQVYQCKVEYSYLMSFEHPNIVKAVALLLDEPVCLLMEYAHLGDMHGMLRKKAGAGLPSDMLSPILTGICEGLIYLHDGQSIVHGDLKPENVLVDTGYRPMICDFDTAVPIGTPLDDPSGTIAYHPPELAGQGTMAGTDGRWLLVPDGASGAIDMWAVGMITLMGLTGMDPETVHAPSDADSSFWMWPCNVHEGEVDTRPNPWAYASSLLKHVLLADLLGQPDPTLRTTAAALKDTIASDEFKESLQDFHDSWAGHGRIVRKTDSIGRVHPPSAAVEENADINIPTATVVMHTDLDDESDDDDIENPTEEASSAPSSIEAPSLRQRRISAPTSSDGTECSLGTGDKVVTGSEQNQRQDDGAGTIPQQLSAIVAIVCQRTYRTVTDWCSVM